MNRRTLPLLVMLFSILVSLSCSLLTGGAQPAEPTTDVYVTAITTGSFHACALLNTGKVKCWGSNDSLQLLDDSYMDHNTPIEIPGLEKIQSISAGGVHTCAVLKNGDVMCWGDNRSGQLGDGTKNTGDSLVQPTGLPGIASISAGADHTCAITQDQNAYCWGKNLYGRVGNGSNTRLIPAPVPVSGFTNNVLSIAAGNEHTCAITTGGAVLCWGRNIYGQVGDDTQKNQTTPTSVVGLSSGVTSIATGHATSCAVTNEQSVVCWGWIGSLDNYATPQLVDGLEKNMISVAAGADFICGLTTDGKVKCLGENGYGQLGNGSTMFDYSPRPIKGLDDVTSISAGFFHACALTAEGRVFCWGDNTTGQLGDGTNTNSPVPVEVTGLVE